MNPAMLLPRGPAPETFDDPAVWDMISGGGARAVHHIESPAMIGLCRQCAVRDIDTLVAIVSVIRPGAANEHKKRDFARRVLGLAPVVYPHPSLATCLKDSHGLVIYEEHILQVCEAFAGLAPGRADVLRRALAKEKTALINEIAGEFAASARARGRSPEEIARVWELVAGFHGYAFCKAHSTAYAVEAYQSAWLKHYFPAEYMASVLTHGKGFYAPLVYVLECLRLGLRLLPPSVNDPGPGFRPVLEGTVPPKTIRTPVSAVQGVGAAVLERVLAERARGPFVSLADFHQRASPGAEEMEALVRAGAFDEFGLSSTAQFWEAQFLRRAGGADPGQPWLLEPGRPAGEAVLPLLQEPGRQERLRRETELLGFPVSDHPLGLCEDVAWETYCPVARLGSCVGQRIVTCGLVIEQRVHHQAGGEPMKFMTLADRTGIVETELFAPAYRRHGLATARYPVLEVEAVVEPFETGSGFSLRVHRAGPPRKRSGGRG